MLERIEWYSDELHKIGEDKGFRPYMSTTQTRLDNTNIVSLIITHEDPKAKRYAGRLSLLEKASVLEDGTRTEPWWIATPSVEHFVVLWPTKRHPYLIRPVVIEDQSTASVDEIIRNHESIPAGLFVEDRTVSEFIKQHIMEGILNYQEYRQQRA